MDKGKLTEEDIAALRRNPNILLVENNTIIFTNAFKFKLVEEYKGGKSVRQILDENGLDIDVIGRRRIDKSRVRWTRAYEKGILDKRDDEFLKNHYAYFYEEKKKPAKKDKYNPNCELLQDIIASKNFRIQNLKDQLDAGIQDDDLKKLNRMLVMDNNLLKAKVEALETVFITQKDKFNYYDTKDKRKYYILAEYLVEKYHLDKGGVHQLLSVMRIPVRGYYKTKANMEAKKETILGDTLKNNIEEK